MIKEKRARFKRPIGLLIIIIIYFLASFLYLAIALVAFFKPDILLNFPGFTQISKNLPNISTIIGIVMLIISLISLIIAIGLLKLQNWARISLLIFLLVMIIGNILSLIAKDYISAINLFFNLAIFSYLFFSKRIRIAFSINGFLFRRNKKANELDKL
jgi:hypothetical protein